MIHEAQPGDHDPLLRLQGEAGRDALKLFHSVTKDQEQWLAMLDRLLSKGDVVELHRNGDWLIYSP